MELEIYNQSWLYTICVLRYATPTPLIVNKSYIQTLALRVTEEDSDGSWIQKICTVLNVPHSLGNSYEQSLAQFYGADGPVNGSWIQALALQLN